jgi:hypothetical protein
VFSPVTPMAPSVTRRAAWVVLIAGMTLIGRDILEKAPRVSGSSAPPPLRAEVSGSAASGGRGRGVPSPASSLRPQAAASPPPPRSPVRMSAADVKPLPRPAAAPSQQMSAVYVEQPLPRPAAAPSPHIARAPAPPHAAAPPPIFAFSGEPSLSLLAAGRCLFYPRCTLFACCSDAVLAEADRSIDRVMRAGIFTCMEDPASLGCAPPDAFPVPANLRLRGHPLRDITITRDILERGLASLPPTPPNALAALRKRSRFSILYLAQGSTPRQALPPWYSTIENLLYLSYRDVDADFYFPRSNFGEGRMALYLAGRQLELQQGWLFDYFVFMDDDVQALSGDDPHFTFEMDLLQWEPAVAGPGYAANLAAPTTTVASTAHIDFIVIAYHRESLEALHPYVTNFDAECTWASQVMQLYEANLAYRNHVFHTQGFKVRNAEHRGYPAECFPHGGPEDRGYPGVYADIQSRISVSRRHCLPQTQVLSKSFPAYLIAGIARPRLRSFFLSRSSTFMELGSASPSCTAETNFALAHCCSLDTFADPAQAPAGAVGQSPLHNRIVAARDTPAGPFSFVWGASRWEFDGEETVRALGFAVSDVVLVDGRELSALPLLDMRSLHAQHSSLPMGMRISITGSSLIFVVGAGGVAYLPSEADAQASPAAAAPPLPLAAWRLRYLAMTAVAHAAAISAGLHF